jgi:hypothetical protein
LYRNAEQAESFLKNYENLIRIKWLFSTFNIVPTFCNFLII